METTRAALVVAAYEFEDPRFQRLRSPSRDVEALAQVLGDPAIGGFTVQTVVNQSGPIVQRELERFFSSRKPEDLLLVYFSGHGVKDTTGKLYFATTNTAFDLLRSTGIPASFVSEQMELTRSKRIVLLLDCCYSGAFLRGFQARGDDSVSVGQLEGRGRAVITASRSTEYAFEADELTAANAQPSIFTGAIVGGLSTGAADRDGDGVVTVDELYDYVYDQVRGKVAGQTPGRWVNLEGELVVARNPRPPVQPAELPAELRKAVDSDVALQRLGAVWALKHWLDDGEPGQKLTARDVLERLTSDYDQRVRTAAVTAVEPPATHEPTTPQPESASPAAETATPSGVVAPTDKATSDAPVASLEGTPPRDALVWTTGWLMVAGVVALSLALFLPFFASDGSGTSLDDVVEWNLPWHASSMLVLVAFVGYAASYLLGRGKPRGRGIAILFGVTPAVVASGSFTAAFSTEADDYGTIGAGLVMMELGLVAIAVAALLSATRSRQFFALSPPRSPRGGARPAVAAVIGATAAIGLGRSTMQRYVFDLDVATRSIWDLTLRLTLLTAMGCMLSGWLHHHRVRGTVRIAGTVLLYTTVVIAFFLAVDPGTAQESFLVAWYSILAVGASVVPITSTLIVPRRRGAILLATWAVASIAVSLPYMVETFDETEPSVRSSAAVAVGAFAVALAGAGLLWLQGRQHPDTGTATSTPAPTNSSGPS